MSKSTLALAPKVSLTFWVTYVTMMLHDHVTPQRANMSHSVAYFLQFHEIIMAKIPPGDGWEG